MANANKDALYVGSLKIKMSHLFPRNFTSYKWCVTKVAHCIVCLCNVLPYICYASNRYELEE